MKETDSISSIEFRTR